MLDHPAVIQTERTGIARYHVWGPIQPATSLKCACGCSQECTDEYEYILGDDGRRYAETECVFKFFGLKRVG